MRFQCLNVSCGKYFGWTAKKIVSDGDHTVYEYVICPYCGSLDFEELPKDYKPPTKSQKPTPPVQMPQPVATKSQTGVNTVFKWKSNQYGEWIFSNTKGAEALVQSILGGGGKFVEGGYEYRLSGEGDKFINRKKVKQ